MRWMKLSAGSLLLAFSFLFMMGSQSNLTGAVTGVLSAGSTTIFSVMTALVGGMIFAAGLESRTVVRSSIKKDRTLVRLAEEASKSDRAQRGFDHLLHEFGKGHAPARIRHLEGTDVFYVGNDEARVYYRLIKGGGYDVVAKSRKGDNQDQVMRKLEKLYPKK